jgi:hypothetical protein
MSNAETVEEKGWQPKVVTGGKGPKDPVGENWLSLLDKGTIFLYRKRTEHPGPNLEPFHVVYQWGDVALLGQHYEDKPDFLQYVDTRLFSNLNQLVKVIYILPKQEQETGESDDNERNRPDQ